MAPQSFGIEVDPGKRGQLLRDRANPGEGTRWQLRGLDAEHSRRAVRPIDSCP
jgi:hypothetical protein